MKKDFKEDLDSVYSDALSNSNEFRKTENAQSENIQNINITFEQENNNKVNKNNVNFKVNDVNNKELSQKNDVSKSIIKKQVDEKSELFYRVSEADESKTLNQLNNIESININFNRNIGINNSNNNYININFTNNNNLANINNTFNFTKANDSFNNDNYNGLNSIKNIIKKDDQNNINQDQFESKSDNNINKNIEIKIKKVAKSKGSSLSKQNLEYVNENDPLKKNTKDNSKNHMNLSSAMNCTSSNMDYMEDNINAINIDQETKKIKEEDDKDFEICDSEKRKLTNNNQISHRNSKDKSNSSLFSISNNTSINNNSKNNNSKHNNSKDNNNNSKDNNNINNINNINNNTNEQKDITINIRNNKKSNSRKDKISFKKILTPINEGFEGYNYDKELDSAEIEDEINNIDNIKNNCKNQNIPTDLSSINESKNESKFDSKNNNILIKNLNKLNFKKNRTFIEKNDRININDNDTRTSKEGKKESKSKSFADNPNAINKINNSDFIKEVNNSITQNINSHNNLNSLNSLNNINSLKNQNNLNCFKTPSKHSNNLNNLYAQNNKECLNTAEMKYKSTDPRKIYKLFDQSNLNDKKYFLSSKTISQFKKTHLNKKKTTWFSNMFFNNNNNDNNDKQNNINENSNTDEQSNCNNIYQIQEFINAKTKFPDIKDNEINLEYFEKKYRIIPDRTKNISKEKNKYLRKLLEIQNFYIDEGPIYVLKFSYDGKYLACGCKNGLIKVLRVKGNDYENYEKEYKKENLDNYIDFLDEKSIVLYGHNHYIVDLCWSPFKTTWLLSASIDRQVILWDIENYKEELSNEDEEYEDNEDPNANVNTNTNINNNINNIKNNINTSIKNNINTNINNKNNTNLNETNEIMIDTTSKSNKNDNMTKNKINSLYGKLSNESINKKIKEKNRKHKICICFKHSFKHKNALSSVCFSPTDGYSFIAGCLDTCVHIWTIPPDNDEYIKLGTTSGDNENVQSQDLDKKKQQISMKSEEDKHYYFNIGEMVTAVAYFPTGSSVAIGTYNGKVYTYDITNKTAPTFEGYFNCRNSVGKNSLGKKVTNIEFINKNSALITTDDSRIRYVSMPDGKLLYKYKGHINETSMIRAFNDHLNDVIICPSEEGYCYIWNLINKEKKREKKNYHYENFKPFNQDSLECSIIANEKSYVSYLKKLAVLTGRIFVIGVIINATNKGRLDVVLNINDTNKYF